MVIRNDRYASAFERNGSRLKIFPCIVLLETDTFSCTHPLRTDTLQ